MAVEYADGKNQHELHNLQCLDKKKIMCRYLEKCYIMDNSEVVLKDNLFSIYIWISTELLWIATLLISENRFFYDLSYKAYSLSVSSLSTLQLSTGRDWP